jgi:hypothetical protein
MHRAQALGFEYPFAWTVTCASKVRLTGTAVSAVTEDPVSRVVVSIGYPVGWPRYTTALDTNGTLGQEIIAAESSRPSKLKSPLTKDDTTTVFEQGTSG